MEDLVTRIIENAVFLRISLAVLSDWILFFFLYLRIESVRSLFETAGVNVELFIKMILAGLTCLLMSIAAIAFRSKAIYIPVSIILALACFFLMSRIRVIEIRSGK